MLRSHFFLTLSRFTLRSVDFLDILSLYWSVVSSEFVLGFDRVVPL